MSAFCHHNLHGLDMYEESPDDWKVFLTQNTFSPITESQCDAISEAVDVSDMLDDGGPCMVSAWSMLSTTDPSVQTAIQMVDPENPGPKSRESSAGVEHTDAKKQRFVRVTDDEARGKTMPSVPFNTVRKNKWAVNIFNDWRSEVLKCPMLDDMKETVTILNKYPDIVQMPDNELTLVLSAFVTALRKKDGSEYKGDSVFGICCALQRHITTNGHSCNFFNDPKFLPLKNAIDNSMQDKCAKNMGIKKKQASAINKADEAYLWDKGYLGSSSPTALIDALFWSLGIIFGLRGGQEHRQMSVKNLEILVDADGFRYLQYTESMSKTYRGGLKHRNIQPHSCRAYENLEEPSKCPVKIFETYISKLPPDRTSDALYFQPLAKPKSEVWYSSQPTGHNKLEKTVQRIMASAGFKGYYTNHSLRTTTATRLHRAGLSDQLIKEQTGHRSNTIESYKRSSDAQKRTVSECLKSEPNKLQVGFEKSCSDGEPNQLLADLKKSSADGERNQLMVGFEDSSSDGEPKNKRIKPDGNFTGINFKQANNITINVYKH